MRPIHWRELVKKTALQLNLPEEFVKEVVLWYWKYYRTEMGKLERTKVEMPGLGTFSLKHWKLEKRMAELRQSIRTTQNHGGNLKKWKICEKYREEFRRVKAAHDIFKEEHKRKDKIRKKQNKMRAKYYPDYLKKLRDKYGIDESVIKSLEEQMANMGGSKKLVSP